MSERSAADWVRDEVDRLEQNNHRRHRRNLEAEALMEAAERISKRSARDAHPSVCQDETALPCIAKVLRDAAEDIVILANVSAGERFKRTLMNMPHPQLAAAGRLRRLADQVDFQDKVAAKKRAVKESREQSREEKTSPEKASVEPAPRKG